MLTGLIGIVLTCSAPYAQNYPKGYFRHPLDIKMELVANFGEIRTNHWHMGLDIRTQQRENLPVYAAADGYIARVQVEPGGFGQAIYIAHPNGYTTLYAHMNGFYPALAQYVKAQQYKQESWAVNLQLPPNLFPIKKGEYIGLSGNTGGSAGPHVHFEIRDTRTDNCLNPLLFGFPIPDAVPPTINRLVMYDRHKSTYHQAPQTLALRRVGAAYTTSPSNTIVVGSNKLSFAVGAIDRFSGTNNPNGIYSAKMWVDGELVSGFELDDIDYDETRYQNAQLDYRWQKAGGATVQHVSPLPGDTTDLYRPLDSDGILYLRDTEPHKVRIEVRDANNNLSPIEFYVRYSGTLAPTYAAAPAERLIPNQVSVFERPDFEAHTTELTVYDTVNVTFSSRPAPAAGSASPLYTFVGSTIPVHDSLTVRIQAGLDVPFFKRDKLVVKSVAGTRTEYYKGTWQNGWIAARFRQFGTYQAFIDDTPPTINGVPTDLTRATRIVLTPRDNMGRVKSFRAELDGRWLLFTNDKHTNYIYRFDERFPPGTHELKVTIEDIAGNVTTRTWTVRR